MLGAIDKDLAAFFAVSETTINNWKTEHPEFLESIKGAKDAANAKVVRSLFERATGYSHPEDKVFSVMDKDGNPLIVPTIKHYPPDTAAAFIWLKNRDSENWRDKTVQEHTGKNGGPIETSDMTEREIARRIAFALAQGVQDPERKEE